MANHTISNSIKANSTQPAENTIHATPNYGRRMQFYNTILKAYQFHTLVVKEIPQHGKLELCQTSQEEA
jgi:hypothetical protein